MDNIYPRPQFERRDWLDLDGEWSFSFDFGKSGGERQWGASPGFADKIRVPFCPESRLSGVAFTDFIECIWYQRSFTVPADWHSSRSMLHFGGVDYRCEVFLDGVSVGVHTGLDSFEFPLDAAPGSVHNLVVRADDNPRSFEQPVGKQSQKLRSAGCSYTRITGIHQSVWLEPLPEEGLANCHMVADFDSGAFVFTPEFFACRRGNKLQIAVCDGACEVGRVVAAAASGVPLRVELQDAKEWTPESPFLYDVLFTVIDAEGRELDHVRSYAGMRKFHVEGDRFYLNNRPIFLRMVLDQGFYPEGIWTAPDDAAIRRDIELSKAAGFNGARLHQKIFSERFHYWADRLGYLTWAEFPDWGMGFWHNARFEAGNIDYQRSFRDYFAQWRSVVVRDRNHPSIVAWTPFNETRGAVSLAEHRRIVGDIYELTRTLDPTRPVNDSSGYVHVKTDIWSVHNYAQEAEEFRTALDTLPVFKNYPEEDTGYRGQPYVPDEFGGVRYLPAERRGEAASSWGYGTVDTAEAAVKRMDELVYVLLHGRFAGYCYTQLTDVEQEQNGIYDYERRTKFDMTAVRRVFSRAPEWSAF